MTKKNKASVVQTSRKATNLSAQFDRSPAGPASGVRVTVALTAKR